MDWQYRAKQSVASRGKMRINRACAVMDSTFWAREKFNIIKYIFITNACTNVPIQGVPKIVASGVSSLFYNR